MSDGWDTLNYKRFEHIEDSSESEGDSHPNIDLPSWKRMKGRMRNEHGLPPRGTETIDAFNAVRVNKSKTSPKEECNENIEEFLKTYRSKLETYALLLDDQLAKKYLLDHKEIVSHSGEGFLITLAVQTSCAGEPSSLNVPLIAKRCLTMHNILSSAKEANIKIEKSITMFFKRTEHERITEQYNEEFEKQHSELLSLIRKRTKVRLAEEKEEAKKPLEITKEEAHKNKAPMGPGGLDPTEVLNSLPKDMQTAFLEMDIAKLNAAMKKLPVEDAKKYLADCVKSGLWIDKDDSNDLKKE